MKTNITKIVGLLFVVGFILTPTLGCRKKKDTIVNIYVRNATNDYIPGANVILYPDQSVPGEIDEKWEKFNTITDASGKASFNFNEIYQLGQSGVAIANIRAILGNVEGQGVIKVVEEETSEETVFI